MVTKSKLLIPEGLRYLIFLFIALHSCLLIYDWYHPEVFLNADRADYRFRTIIGIVSSPELINFLSTHGILGDYVFQAIAYSIGGRMGVIVTQLVLSLTSIVFVYRIAFLLSSSRFTSQLSTIVYFFLPHTLAYPHLLASESLSNPLTIISIYYLLRYLSNQGSAPKDIILSAIFISIAMLIRPIALLFPIFVIFLLLLCKKFDSPQTIFKYFGVAYAPVILWMTFMLATTGNFSLGNSGSTLGLNLFQKAERMQQSAKSTQRVSSEFVDSKSLSVGDYTRYVASNPMLATNLLKYDLANLLVNSGANKLFSYYLNIYEAEKAQSRAWRKIIDKDGILAGIANIVRQSDAYVRFTIISTAIWVTILFGALFGAFVFWNSSAQSLAEKLIIIFYPLYVIFFTLALVSYPRSGHRSSFEFIVSILFSFLIANLLSRWRRRESIKGLA